MANKFDWYTIWRRTNKMALTSSLVHRPRFMDFLPCNELPEGETAKSDSESESRPSISIRSLLAIWTLLNFQSLYLLQLALNNQFPLNFGSQFIIFLARDDVTKSKTRLGLSTSLWVLAAKIAKMKMQIMCPTSLQLKLSWILLTCKR